MKHHRLISPITNPLSYARAVALIQGTKRTMKVMGLQVNQALEREGRLLDENKALKEERDRLKADLVIANDNFSRLQMEKGAIPLGGRHSDLVIQLVDNIISHGSAEFRYNDNGPDEMVCPQCGASAYIRQGDYSIEHAKDCAYTLATMIRDSQPD